MRCHMHNIIVYSILIDGWRYLGVIRGAEKPFCFESGTGPPIAELELIQGVITQISEAEAYHIRTKHCLKHTEVPSYSILIFIMYFAS